MTNPVYIITPEQHVSLLDALAESRVDVDTCLMSAMELKGIPRYDARIAAYQEQLTKHDAALTMLLSMKPSEPCAWRTEESTNGVSVWLFRKTAVKYQDQPDALYAKDST